MQIEFGNPRPVVKPGEEVGPYPYVTYIGIPDGLYSFDPNVSAGEVYRHFYDGLARLRPDQHLITRLPGNDLLVHLLHPVHGMWTTHCDQPPTWVWCDNESVQAFLAQFFNCPAGRPDFLEDTHYTRHGPPGVVPGATLDLQMNITTFQQQRASFYMSSLSFQSSSSQGIQSPVTITSATPNSVLPGTAVAENDLGLVVICDTGTVGIITGHSGTASISVDQWYNSGIVFYGLQASTPTAGQKYITLPVPPAIGLSWIGLSTDTTALANPFSGSALNGTELTGGLARAKCSSAYTAPRTTTLTATWTAGPGDVPVTVGSFGVFCSIVVGANGCMRFINLLAPTATLSVSGDQLTITETITGT